MDHACKDRHRWLSEQLSTATCTSGRGSAWPIPRPSDGIWTPVAKTAQLHSSPVWETKFLNFGQKKRSQYIAPEKKSGPQKSVEVDGFTWTAEVTTHVTSCGVILVSILRWGREKISWDKLNTCHDSNVPRELPGNYGTYLSTPPRTYTCLYARNCLLKHIIDNTRQRQGLILHTQETKF